RHAPRRTPLLPDDDLRRPATAGDGSGARAPAGANPDDITWAIDRTAQVGAPTDATGATAVSAIAPLRCGGHSDGDANIRSDRPPDQLAADRRSPGGRRGAVRALSRDRACSGVARLPGRAEHLAVHDVPCGDRTL